MHRLAAAGHEIAVFHREAADPDDALRKTVAWQRQHLPELPVDYAQEDRLLAELRA